MMELFWLFHRPSSFFVYRVSLLLSTICLGQEQRDINTFVICLHTVDFTTSLLFAQRVSPLRFVGINKHDNPFLKPGVHHVKLPLKSEPKAEVCFVLNSGSNHLQGVACVRPPVVHPPCDLGESARSLCWVVACGMGQGHPITCAEIVRGADTSGRRGGMV